jgi:flagellin
MVVNHNMASIVGSRQLRYNVKKMEDSSKKLATGYKVNAANDDAAGLEISETMRHQVRGLNRASSNTQDGISMLQTADAALQETQEILDRMAELTTQGANDVHTDEDRSAIQDELDQLNKEIDRIAYTTHFNQQYMLAEGTPQAAPGYFQIQTGALAGQSITIQFVNASKESLGVDKVDVSSHSAAGASMDMVQNAIEKAAEWRDVFGAQQTRLERAMANTDNTSENTQSSESNIRDTNMNMEMVLYSTNRILVQASQSILAQYNDDAKAVIEILK